MAENRLHPRDIAIVDEHGLAVAVLPVASGHTSREAWDRHAGRLCACWNACQGIPTEALEDGAVKELIAALRKTSAAIRRHYDAWAVADYDYVVALAQADAAIAKTKAPAHA